MDQVLKFIASIVLVCFSIWLLVIIVEWWDRRKTRKMFQGDFDNPRHRQPHVDYSDSDELILYDNKGNLDSFATND